MNTWKHCSVHGPGDENSWGCPECVRELRKAVAERDARIATLEKELAEWKESARVDAELAPLKNILDDIRYILKNVWAIDRKKFEDAFLERIDLALGPTEPERGKE